MSIICLEGASSVGKTTTSKVLERMYGCKRIPEVNELFQRSSNKDSEWYLEKQLERWAMARQISAAGGIAVLDGDPFQPLWYNWIFSDLGFQDINSVIDFYAIALKDQKIKFPDKYFILTIAENELRNRKNKDTNRSRSNFELHLKLIKPQLAYFASMNEIYDGIAEVIVANDPIHLANSIYSSKYHSDYDQLQLLKKQVDFINT